MAMLVLWDGLPRIAAAVEWSQPEPTRWGRYPFLSVLFLVTGFIEGVHYTVLVVPLGSRADWRLCFELEGLG